MTQGTEGVIERKARELHDSYERLAPKFGYETRDESRVEWQRLDPKLRALMIAAVDEVFGPIIHSQAKALSFIAHRELHFDYVEWKME